MLLELKGISKSYESKQVLKDVSISFTQGKIHALLGENGAGKTTLAKIITGTIKPTAGSIYIDGKEVFFNSPFDALKNKISIIEQRPLLASSLTVKENIFLSYKESIPTKRNCLKNFFIPPVPSTELIKLKDRWCPSLNFSSFVKDLGGNLKFYVTLLEALLRQPSFLVLDEPSAFLNIEERKKLYSSLQELSKNGCTILVITHSPLEAERYADNIIKLKEGVLSKGETSLENVSFIKSNEFGKEKKSAANTKSTSIKFTNCSSTPKTKSALLSLNLTCSSGEISAITGVKESAIDTLEDFITGMADSKRLGSVSINDKTIKASKLNSSFLRKNKTAIVPSDKTFRASNPSLTIEQMLTSYYTGRDSYSFTQNLIKKASVNIKPSQPCSDLSGGMLQRLILERELSLDQEIVILCNPMQGLDTQSQSTLIKRILSLKEEQKAILLVGAEDFPLTLCTRVYNLESGLCKLVMGEE